MSSPQALATVTATLQHLMLNIAPGASVTTKPPSTARNGSTGEQINIFLYSTHHNTAFNNAPMPGETRNGEHAFPPMPLVLKYLITTYGLNDDDISGQQLMGQAMSLLHDHPILGPSDIVGITPDSRLHEQVERIRITPDALSLDDMSKLWTSFQSAEYRLSTGYEVSVILIESTRAGRTPLPVIKRGEENRGAHVTATTPAVLSGIRFAQQKPAAEPGDIITLLGRQMSIADTVVRFNHPLLASAIDLPASPESSAEEMTLALPTVVDDPELGSKWPAGFYAVSLVKQSANIPTIVSNSISMPFSPTIESVSPSSAPAGNVALTIECLPQIVQDQRVSLLFGERRIAPDAVTTPADPAARSVLQFTVDNAVARATPYVLRIRVDGVDSLPVDFSGASPQFDPGQQVTIL